MEQQVYKTEGVNRTQTMRFHPFVFTGKERDEETGYGYFCARYMDHELTTMWLSVDPMSDKYPSLSPYNYCAWNPVKLVDPDGEEMLDTKYVTETGGLIVETNDGMNDPMKDVVIISKERQSNFENKVRELDLENTLDNPNNRSVLERHGESLSDYKDDFCRSGDDSYLATGIRATYQDTYDGKSTFWFRLVYNLGALGEGAMGQETTTAAELSSGARLGYDMGSYDRINGLINRINPYQTLDRTLKEGPSYHRLTTAERNSQKKEWHPYICY